MNPKTALYACLLTALAVAAADAQSTTDGMMDDDMDDGMMHEEEEDSPGVGVAATLLAIAAIAGVALARRRLG
jgi:hypothetical protein